MRVLVGIIFVVEISLLIFFGARCLCDILVSLGSALVSLSTDVAPAGASGVALCCVMLSMGGSSSVMLPAETSLGVETRLEIFCNGI